MKKVIFGHEVEVRSQTCSINGITGSAIDEPYINLYVRLTNNCNASCEFCEFNGADHDEFDTTTFMYVLYRLYREVKINKIAFTGGEPTLMVDTLNAMLKAINTLDPSIYTVVNTNGYNMKDLDLTYINSVSLSRHAILDGDNHRHFATTDLASNMEITDFPDKSKLHLSCNLIKGQVDSAIKTHEYIEHFSKLGVIDVGFVSLMKVNEYCKRYHVDFSDIDLGSMPDTISTISMSQGNEETVSCKCANYLTSTKNGAIVKSYARYYSEPESCSAILVYDQNKLQVGFGGQVLFR